MKQRQATTERGSISRLIMYIIAKCIERVDDHTMPDMLNKC